MKKIALITLTGHDNYGNRLQNYALQKVLELNQYKVETIWREKENNKPIMMKIYNIKENLVLLLKSIQTKQNLFLLRKKRKNLFLDFHNKYIHLSKYESKGLIEKKIDEDYDFFIAGSDQIWNYHYPSMNRNSFLAFASYDKTLSYAASFGVNEIPKKWYSFYKENLKYIKNISVREKTGKGIIKEVINKDVPEVLDPTLLLSEKLWKSISKKPKKDLPEKYLLTYFLGNVSSDIQENIKKIAQEKNLKVINLMEGNNNLFYLSGPLEFIYLIQNANLMITDSFHGTVFSVIFKKDFYVYNRNYRVDMSSRVYSLLNLLDLEDRFISNKKIDLKRIDYNKCYKKLESECKKSMDFLSNALNNPNLKSFYN